MSTLLKKLFLSSALSFFWFMGIGQITSSPSLPTVNDEVVITLDATQGGGGLAGYTGNVYAHTGVIIEADTEWNYVIGGWNELDVKPQLTRIADDLYELIITPSITEFYSIQGDDVVTKLCFVFRGEETTSPPQTEDLFINVVQEGLTVS
ncbi:MAG TPA: hypothetical protein PLV65_13220, partial [Tenuifilaceae bacterium]|nr:hypothetical protein [Tenuifilaceae bacterium]